MNSKTETFQKVAMLVAALILIINFGFDSLIALIGIVTGLGGEVIEPVIIYTPLTLGIFLALCEAPEIIKYLKEEGGASVVPIVIIFSGIILVVLFITSSISRFHLTLLYEINSNYLTYDPSVGLSGNSAWEYVWRASPNNKWKPVVMLLIVIGGFLEIYRFEGFLTSVIAGIFLAWSWRHFEPSTIILKVLLLIVVLFFLATFPMAYFANLLE